MKLKTRKDHRTTQNASQTTAGETVLSSSGWIKQLMLCIASLVQDSAQQNNVNVIQVLRERVRSTTEGEVLLNRLLGGEGSALGDMVR